MLSDAEHKELAEMQQQTSEHAGLFTFAERMNKLYAKSHVPPDGWTGAEAFFYEHAGYGYDPKIETAEQGRQRVAREMAAAEAWAKSVDLRFVWRDDEDGYMDAAANGEEFETCEWVAAYPADAFDDDRDMGFGPPHGGSVPLASLGGITDATVDYRRVVEAELALEARGVVERADAHAKLIAPILEDLKAARDRLSAVLNGMLGGSDPRKATCQALAEVSTSAHRMAVVLYDGREGS